MADKLNVAEWRISCGMERHELAQKVGVSNRCIQEAESPHGIPIAQAVADKILAALSEAHGRPIRIEDVKDLKTI